MLGADHDARLIAVARLLQVLAGGRPIATVPKPKAPPRQRGFAALRRGRERHRPLPRASLWRSRAGPLRAARRGLPSYACTCPRGGAGRRVTRTVAGITPC